MFLRALALVALLAAEAAGANPVAADVELTLVVDVSPSIDIDDFLAQRHAYASVFQDRVIQAAIATLPNGLDVRVVFFSLTALTRLGPVRLTDAASADALAKRWLALRRSPPLNHGTNIAAGLALAIAPETDPVAARRVVIVLADGPQNTQYGCPGAADGRPMACERLLKETRQQASERGVAVIGIAISFGELAFAAGEGSAYLSEWVVTDGGMARDVTAADDLAGVVRATVLGILLDAL